MNKKIILTYIDNESHGYIKISKYDLKGLDIDIKQFSSYSYYNNNNACYYLEEDLDATILINILKSKGYIVEYNTKYVDTSYLDQDKFARIS